MLEEATDQKESEIDGEQGNGLLEEATEEKESESDGEEDETAGGEGNELGEEATEEKESENEGDGDAGEKDEDVPEEEQTSPEKEEISPEEEETAEGEETAEDKVDQENEPEGEEETSEETEGGEEEADEEADKDEGSEIEGAVDSKEDTTDEENQDGADADAEDEAETDSEDEEDGTEPPEAAGSSDEESDEEDMLPDTFIANTLSGAQHGIGSRPNAGHSRARTKEKQMDRFKDTIKDERQSYLLKRKGIGHFLRKDGTRDKRGKPLEQTPPEEMTKAMKQYTPGTSEFDKRKKALIARMNRGNRKARKDADTVVLKKESLPFRKDVRKPGFAKKAAEHIPGLKRMVKMTEEEELILDVSLSLTVALETGLMMGIDDLKARTVMRRWLDLLSVSLPPEWGIHRLIDDLRSRFTYATKNKDIFRTIIREHPLPRQGWSSSCKTNRSASGFSCGFWKLLHTVAVGVAEQQGGKSLVVSGMMSPTTKTFSPMEAADTIRDYINEFFTCRPCRENFVKNYDACENNRRCDRLTDEIDGATTADWKELPLWLWEVHNEVSVRIVKERVESSYGPKGVKNHATVKDEVGAIWPNVETCILCFNGDGTWNEGQIFRFLEKSYWPDAELDPMHDKLLTFDGEASSGLGAMLALTLLILWAVYSVIGKHSSSIQHSVLAARHAVSRRAGLALGGGGKTRSA